MDSSAINEFLFISFSINERSKRRFPVIDMVMKIRNVKLKTIEARRYSDPDQKPRQIRIDHNSQITQMTTSSSDKATIEFQYTASYGPVGMIKFEGVLLYEDAKARSVAMEWQKNRKMPNEIASRIHTAVMHACVPEAVGIAKNLGLPPPIPLPQVRLGAKPSKGTTGPEIA
jgi:hypothetical protein